MRQKKKKKKSSLLNENDLKEHNNLSFPARTYAGVWSSW